jgi:hypothetical protein
MPLAAMRTSLCVGPRFNSSEYWSMRVEDPVNRRGGLKLGPVLTLNQNLIFEMASNKNLKKVLKGLDEGMLKR